MKKYSIEHLKSQLKTGRTVYDSVKDEFLTDDEWQRYGRTTYEAEAPGCSYAEWCDDPDFIDVENMLGELEVI